MNASAVRKPSEHGASAFSAQNRVMKALSFETPDRVPRYDCFWGEFAEMCRQELDIPADSTLEDYFGVDVCVVAADETPFPSLAREISKDGVATISQNGWGTIVRHREGAFFHEVIKQGISGDVDPEKLVFEAPELDSRYTGFMEVIDRERPKRCVFAKIGGPYLRTAFMRGQEDFLIDMVTDPGYAKALIDRVADHLLSIGEESLRRGGLKDTGIWIFDDMGNNRGPMMSPAVFENLFAPAYKRLVAGLKSFGARKVCLHSDGNIEPILDMLVDAGIDGLHPVEPRAGLSMVRLRERYGGKLALMGGMCNSQILPDGPEEQIVEHAREIVDLARSGGVVIGSHSIGPDISVKHYLAYDRVVRTEGVFAQNGGSD